ncbi:MAG: hypothetical protein NC914_01350, partial [Candidatus Omnitrophica bacterium]|nr:hypothetical protein [Candidatus Omnitrophota bacterium]
QDIPKTTKPLVELYVMSLCPYGIKAEKKILPLMDYFCNSVDFKIRYIVNVNGQMLDDVISLHGIDEVKENLRQAAILRFQADKFPAYLEKIDKGICLAACGAAKLDDYWKKAAKEVGINIKQVESFAYGPEGLAMLKRDAESVKKYAVKGSPTLMINGVKSDSIYTDAEVVKKEICSAFSETPAVCKSYL